MRPLTVPRANERLPTLSPAATPVRISMPSLEAVQFVASFRGRQIGAGRKSVTLRVRFRAPDHTLVHESVDGQVGTLVKTLQKDLGAEIRT